MIDLSIIIPVYNVENYIKRCLDSILIYKEKNIEIILINDGSTDNSIKILEDYQKNDERIKIISRKNKGLSISRNEGIKNSQGDYIWFVDSDDWIDISEINELINLCKKNQLDILSFNFKEIRGKKILLVNKYINYKNSILRGLKYLEDSVYKRHYKVSPCSNIYKRRFITDNKLFFLEKVYNEDIEHSTKSLVLAEKFMCLNKCFYYYEKRENSITNSKDILEKRLESLILIEKNLVVFFEEKRLLEKEYIKILLANKIFFQILSMLRLDLFFVLKTKKRLKTLYSFQEMKNINSLFYRGLYYFFKLF